jgi:hypothetical protein
MGAQYCAIYRQPGCHDEILVGEDRKPLKFETATHAINAARRAYGLLKPKVAISISDQMRKQKAERRLEIGAERDRLFPPEKARDQPSNVIVITKRKRLP